MNKTNVVTNSETTPWTVSEVNQKIAGWIDKLGAIWIEGQVTQISKRPGTHTAFFTLRDPNIDMSVSVTCHPELLNLPEGSLIEGDHIVIFAKPNFYIGRGNFSLKASVIKKVGLGQLLANIEILRKQLEKEGLFAPERKKRIPFLPKKIGLITGRASAAERDVTSVSKLRWPEVKFTIINTAVQGITAANQIIEALKQLDTQKDIEVIIIARGGGSVEDLLPFSDEKLCRTISECNTPIVSAIGHEPDHPLTDEVADLRAATPTDAAKRVVPDIMTETNLITDLRYRIRGVIDNIIQNNKNQLTSILTRPIIAKPKEIIKTQIETVTQINQNLNSIVTRLINNETENVTNLLNQLKNLGPYATLSRGYAVLQQIDNFGNLNIITDISELNKNNKIKIRLKNGIVTASIESIHTKLN